MITRLTTVEELQGIFTELLLNHTDKVTKVSPLSVNSAIGYGVAKIGQRTLKDIALIESHLFPDSAFGEHLDTVAENNGIAPRFTSSQSSTYVRVVGAAGTVYSAGVHTITGNQGVVFDIEQNYTLPTDGFGYIKVRSQTSGESTNVDPLSLTRISPVPTGHQYCINEFKADGGRDDEDDESFRIRIKEGSNILARGTISMLEQVFMKINNNVFKIYNQGMDANGNVVIAVLSQNGIDFSAPELNNILLQGKKFFSLTELKPDGVNGYGIRLINPTWFPVDVSARLTLESSVNADDVRKEIQIRLQNYFNYKYFDKEKVEWDDLLGIVKGTPGVKYVLDNYFSPRIDQPIPLNQFARMRGFLMLNPDGTLISNSSGTLNPAFYPQTLDFSYQKTVFSSIS